MSQLRSIGHAIPISRPHGRVGIRRRRKTLSALIWSHFKAQPGFLDEQREALRDLKEGRAIPLRDIPRDR